MSVLRPERWRALEPHLDRALEMPAGERPAWIAHLRKEDPAMAADLELLLAEREELGRRSFLEGEPAGPPHHAPLAGQAVGAYTLVEPIGQGGMGTVWLARRSDGRFEGNVAVKLLNAGLVGRAAGERFRREGSILARLSHPHIARLLDAGVSAAGQPYIVLDHVDGEPIDRYCASHRLPVAARLRLFLEVCDAVARAHASLVVHRDIKPSNVLVGADGAVKLLDFGIAKLLEGDTGSGEATDLTREGGRALTPDFAAPEQLTGGAITTATDVYALGVLLTLLLTGRHPAGEAPRSPADIVRAILESEPPRLSDLVRRAAADPGLSPPDATAHRLAGDLDTIAARALKKNAAERYASVAALAEDVRRHLAREPIAARPDTLGYRLRKFVSRHRAGVAVAAVVLAAALATTAAFVRQARETRRQRDAARDQLARATAANEFLGFLLSTAAPAGRMLSQEALLEQGEALAEKQFADDPALRAEMLATIGQQYTDSENWVRAIPVLERAARTASDPGLRARALCGLALAQMATGKAAEARTTMDGALAGLPRDPQYALERAGCLCRRSEFGYFTDEAAPMIENARAALEALRASPVSSRAQTLDAMAALAYGYYLAREGEKAGAAYAELLAALEKAGRGRTTAAADALNNWSLVYFLGELVRAEPLLRRSLELRRSIEGPDVVPTLLFNYASVLYRLARYDEAEPLYEETIRTAHQREERRIEMDAIMELSDMHAERGELDRAAADLRRLDAGMLRAPEFNALRRAHLDYSEGVQALARGDAALARQRLAESTGIYERSKVKMNLTVFAFISLARAELAVGNPDAALAAANRALEVSRSFVAEGTPSYLVGHSLAALGEAELASGNRAAAKATLTAAADQQERTLGNGHPAAVEARRLADAAREGRV